MRLVRIGSADFPVWDGADAARFGGRWNRAGSPVIYAAGSLALAMLERLVQRGVIGSAMVVMAEVPEDVAVTDLLGAPPPGWMALGSPEAVAAGAAWLRAGATALLRVPSVLVPSEPNYAINPAHPDAARIAISEPVPLIWGPRLFGVPPPPG